MLIRLSPPFRRVALLLGALFLIAWIGGCAGDTTTTPPPAPPPATPGTPATGSTVDTGATDGGAPETAPAAAPILRHTYNPDRYYDGENGFSIQVRPSWLQFPTTKGAKLTLHAPLASAAAPLAPSLNVFIVPLNRIATLADFQQAVGEMVLKDFTRLDSRALTVDGRPAERVHFKRSGSDVELVAYYYLLGLRGYLLVASLPPATPASTLADIDIIGASFQFESVASVPATPPAPEAIPALPIEADRVYDANSQLSFHYPPERSIPALTPQPFGTLYSDRNPTSSTVVNIHALLCRMTAAEFGLSQAFEAVHHFEHAEALPNLERTVGDRPVLCLETRMTRKQDGAETPMALLQYCLTVGKQGLVFGCSTPLDRRDEAVACLEAMILSLRSEPVAENRLPTAAGLLQAGGAMLTEAAANATPTHLAPNAEKPVYDPARYYDRTRNWSICFSSGWMGTATVGNAALSLFGPLTADNPTFRPVLNVYTDDLPADLPLADFQQRTIARWNDGWVVPQQELRTFDGVPALRVLLAAPDRPLTTVLYLTVWHQRMLTLTLVIARGDAAERLPEFDRMAATLRFEQSDALPPEPPPAELPALAPDPARSYLAAGACSLTLPAQAPALLHLKDPTPGADLYSSHSGTVNLNLEITPLLAPLTATQLVDLNKQSIVNNMPGYQAGSETDLTVADLPARRIDFTATLNGHPWRFALIGIVRDHTGYLISTNAPAAEATPLQAVTDPLLASFRFEKVAKDVLPGAPPPAPPKPEEPTPAPAPAPTPTH